jgi:hypothetical protein
MATNRDLLKEAIADAKAVKETAIANAKAALEEAFTPQLKSMFAAKLQEMEHEDELEEALGTINDPDTPTAHGNIAEEDLDEYAEIQPTDLPRGMSGVEKDEDMMEIDLEELLRELEMEEGDMEESLNEAEGDDEDDMEMSDENSKEGDEEGTPIDLEDMTDEDLKTMIEDVIKDMIASGELEGGEEEMGSEEGVEMKDEEEVDLAELLKEIEEMEDIDSLEEAKKKKEEKEDEDKKKMKKELGEAYSVIKTLKSELNEINLLNAKLLYTNKIFKAKNLNESQKVKVLSSFDKAITVGEVKLVFETLNEGIKVKSNVIKENLGRASKGTVTPNVKKPIVESNEAFLRMQKLAGII